jgi:hypothetical protein
MSRIDPIREAQAVLALKESLAAIHADDDETLLLDSIEGETGFCEAIDILLARMASDAVLIEGTKSVVSDLEARAARFAKRIAANRAVIEQAMMIAELDKLERPSATLSLAKRQAKVEIQTEADIPAEFWKVGAPSLDKKAVGEALKEGRAVPGACLSNAAPSLSVRTK